MLELVRVHLSNFVWKEVEVHLSFAIRFSYTVNKRAMALKPPHCTNIYSISPGPLDTCLNEHSYSGQELLITIAQQTPEKWLLTILNSAYSLSQSPRTRFPKCSSHGQFLAYNQSGAYTS